MLRAILTKDIAQFRRDRRFALLAGVIAALALAAFVIGTLAQSRSAADHVSAVESDRTIWEGQGEVNPHSAAHFGQYAFKLSPALALFDPGFTPFLGQAVWIEAHYQNPAEARPAEAWAGLQRFGDLSPAWLLQTLLPLLVILIGFGAIAGERDGANLRLQLIQGARARQLVLGRAIGLFVTSALILVPLMALGLLGAGIAGMLSGDALGRWMTLFLAYIFYLAVWCSLTVAVSCLAVSARQALVVLLGIWSLSIVLLPRIAAEEAVAAHPVPAAGEFWSAVAEARAQGIDGHDPSDARAQVLQQETLSRYGVARIDDLPVDFAAISLQAGEEYGNVVFDRLYGEIAAAERAQVSRQLWYAPLSPLIALKPLSMGASGSDLVHQQHFLAAAEAHRRDVQRLLNDEQARTGKGQNFNNRAAADFWIDVPTFQYEPPSLASIARAYLPATAALLLWLLAATVLMLLASRWVEARA